MCCLVGVGRFAHAAVADDQRAVRLTGALGLFSLDRAVAGIAPGAERRQDAHDESMERPHSEGEMKSVPSWA